MDSFEKLLPSNSFLPCPFVTPPSFLRRGCQFILNTKHDPFHNAKLLFLPTFLIHRLCPFLSRVISRTSQGPIPFPPPPTILSLVPDEKSRKKSNLCPPYVAAPGYPTVGVIFFRQPSITPTVFLCFGMCGPQVEISFQLRKILSSLSPIPPFFLLRPTIFFGDPFSPFLLFPPFHETCNTSPFPPVRFLGFLLSCPGRPLTDYVQFDREDLRPSANHPVFFSPFLPIRSRTSISKSKNNTPTVPNLHESDPPPPPPNLNKTFSTPPHTLTCPVGGSSYP